jgi:hypothetical protein
MTDPGEGGRRVTVEMTAEDQSLLEDLVEGSPFPEQVLLRIALKIGMMTIQRDPKVLLRFIGKKGPG